MLQFISTSILSLCGWKAKAEYDIPEQFLLIGAPHTSNWDFPLTLLGLSSIGIRFSWVAKHTLFKGPVGMFFKKIGGIPVNRSVRGGFLSGMVEAFQINRKLILAIAPEGTRSKTDHWKAGFYHIATKADVEICLGYLDYPTKTIGLGPTLKPSGDMTADFKIIQDFYANKTGKFPEKQSEIKLRDKELAIFAQKTGK
ncbi:MAG: acyltransferase [Desulfobulbaceae bacterium]|nr:acyltransferase [Desulfobulbaceae bacterium]